MAIIKGPCKNLPNYKPIVIQGKNEKPFSMTLTGEIWEPMAIIKVGEFFLG